MRRVALAAGLVLCGGLVTGCAAEVDLGKSMGTRKTVPAGADVGGEVEPTSTDQPTGPAKTNDPAFTSEKLRLVNPCALMDQETMSALGTPAESRLRDYVMCSNYMTDKSGKELNFTLTIGETVSGNPTADLNVGGLPAVKSELDDKTACFMTAITETQPNRGITVQIGGDKGTDLCGPGTKLLESVVGKIRAGAPKLAVEKGSLVELKPCEVLDEATVTTAIGAGSTSRPYSLHQCNYNVSGVSFSIQFRIGTDPKELSEVAKTTPVDLGGVTGYQRTDTSSAGRCRLEFAHVPFKHPNEDDQTEIVDIDFSRYTAKAGEDPCAVVQAVAKAVIPKLPAK